MNRFSVAAAAGLLVATAGLLVLQAQDPDQASSESSAPETEMSVSDPICSFFGPDHDMFVAALRDTRAASHLTEDVVGKLGTSAKVMGEVNSAMAGLPSAPGGSRTDAIQYPATGNIDKYIFQNPPPLRATISSFCAASRWI
jgi:hypothetical protein